MTDRLFNLDTVAVEVLTIEQQLANATSENIQADISNGLGFVEGFIGGVKVPETILDNKVPSGALTPVIDEDGNDVTPEATFEETFAFHPVSNDGNVLMHLAGGVEKRDGIVLGSDCEKTLPLDILNALGDYIARYYADAEVFTKSAFLEECDAFNKAQTVDE